MMHESEWLSRQITPALPRPLLDDAAYTGTIPQHYHRGIGPFLFEPFALHTAERIRARAPRTVLETACGTGIVTRRLREALPYDALLVATDLNEPMLAVARRTVGPSINVAWACADMSKLKFSDGEFDAVVCQFGLMSVPDKLAAVREARRVLRPGGSFLVTTWGSLERNPVVALAHRTLGAVFPNDPPLYLARAPFGDGDPDLLTDLLVGGGFQDVVVDVVEKAASSPRAHDLAMGLIEGYPLIDELQLRDESRVPVAVNAVARAIRLQFGDAPVRGRITALVASAVA
ncbi:MAG TPA: methyltransferase domain-containing protein [Kofleriaceae bacterium]|jgi:SAM-dependent methyltransferase|nr:methyltransferase domain-containing protein [Kofleriaceae bacterium]